MPDGMCKILVVMRPGTVIDKLSTLLLSLGFRVSDVCHSGGQALRSIMSRNYDIVLASYNLPDMTGLNMALDMLDHKEMSIILITTDQVKNYIADKFPSYDITCLIKPVNRIVLQQTLEITWKYRRMKKERDRLRRTLDNRALMAKAKGILMDRYDMSEPEAYRALQKRSMNTGVPAREIAQKVIDTDGLAYFASKEKDPVSTN